MYYGVSVGTEVKKPYTETTKTVDYERHRSHNEEKNFIVRENPQRERMEQIMTTVYHKDVRMVRMGCLLSFPLVNRPTRTPLVPESSKLQSPFTDLSTHL